MDDMVHSTVFTHVLLLTAFSSFIATLALDPMFVNVLDSLGEPTTLIQFGSKVRFICGCRNAGVLGFVTPGEQMLSAIYTRHGRYRSDDLIVDHWFQLGDYKCLCDDQSHMKDNGSFTVSIPYRTCNITEAIKYRKNCKPDEEQPSICVKTTENLGKDIDKCTSLTIRLCEATHQIRKQPTANVMCLDENTYSVCEAYALYQDENWGNLRTFSVQHNQDCEIFENKRDLFAVNQDVISSDQKFLSCDQLAKVPRALDRLEYGSIRPNSAGVLRFCFFCGVNNEGERINVTRKIRSQTHLPDSSTLRCDRDGYANELLVNLTPNDRCGRIKHLVCQYDLNYDRSNFISTIRWKLNGVIIKPSLVKVHKEEMSVLAIKKRGNYTCIVETLFNMAETRDVIRDENYASFIVNESCLAANLRKKDSGVLMHVFIASGIIMVALVVVLLLNIMYQKNLIGGGRQHKKRRTYSTSKTASISPRSINVERPKSPPISSKSKSKSKTST